MSRHHAEGRALRTVGRLEPCTRGILAAPHAALRGKSAASGSADRVGLGIRLLDERGISGLVEDERQLDVGTECLRVAAERRHTDVAAALDAAHLPLIGANGARYVDLGLAHGLPHRAERYAFASLA